MKAYKCQKCGKLIKQEKFNSLNCPQCFYSLVYASMVEIIDWEKELTKTT